MDIKTYLPYAILTKVDIASMMHGLEVRTPMVDIRVAEFAATIPERYNIASDARQHWTAKSMLKKNASRWYPKGFLNRPKQGFGLPTSQWLGQGGTLSGAVSERLQDPASPLRDYFSSGGIADILRANAAGTMWLLLVLDEWLCYEKQPHSLPG
jgi:asparagine synthase (glutamine-hydrolysing)